MIPVALLVTIGVFVLVRISPGDPALVFAGEERDPAALAAIREQMGLDKPLPVQYVVWVTTLATASLAVNLRQVRSSLLDVFGHEYMRTARAKGLRERTVITRHALKNALIPVVTLIGIQIGAIIEGAFITETIFFWPGIGRLAVTAIPSQDYPVVQGVVLVSAFSYMLTTLAVDVLYAWLDPRISYETATA